MRISQLGIGSTFVVALLLASALLAGCGDDSSTGEGSASRGSSTTSSSGEPSAGEGTIKFGQLAGVTGPYAPFTAAQRKAANLAIADINAAGGVLGKQVSLVAADDQSSPEAAIGAFDRLVNVDKVVAIGGVSSNSALALREEIEQRQVPTTCPQCGSSELDEAGGEWLWRLMASDTDTMVAAAQYARDRGWTKMSILAIKNEDSSSAADGFARAFTNGVGGEICADVRFDAGQSNYQGQVAEAFGCEPNAIFMTTGMDAGIPIVKEWARRGYGSEFLMSSDLVVPEIAGATPELNGKVSAVIAAFDRSSPAWKSFSTRFEEETGDVPTEGLWEAGAYDEFVLHSLAIAEAGTDRGPKVSEAWNKVASPPGKVCYEVADCLELIEAGTEIDYYGASGASNLNEYGNLTEPTFTTFTVADNAWQTGEVFALDEALKAQVQSSGN